MTFEGIPRASQLNPYADGMNPYAAAHAAKTDQAGRPLVKGLQKEEKIKSVTKEDQQQHDHEEEDPQEEPFTEEEAEQVRIFARMRGIMNFSLESGARYEFAINPDTGLVDLTAATTGQVVLTLTPEELVQLSRKIHRYAGVLTDHSG